MCHTIRIIPNAQKLSRLPGVAGTQLQVPFSFRKLFSLSQKCISTFHCAFRLLFWADFFCFLFWFVFIFWYFNCQMKQNENIHSLLWAIWFPLPCVATKCNFFLPTARRTALAVRAAIALSKRKIAKVNLKTHYIATHSLTHARTRRQSR